jgi:tetratricopeptide (TPR) repeat protein
LARLVSWTIVVLALVGVASLVSLPLLAKRAAEHAAIARPEALPPEPQIPEERAEPLAPVSELNESLRIPRVDTTLRDEHSQKTLEAYYAGDYEKALQEAVLSLDPTPLEENPLYRAVTTTTFRDLDPYTNADAIVEKPNGRPTINPIDTALQPILDESKPQDAARLNNAAAMLILHSYTRDIALPSDSQETYDFPAEPWVARELAYQAADLQPSYCPALLNLTFFDGMGRVGEASFFHIDDDLNPAGGLSDPNGEPWVWTNYYPAEGCEDPALLYYRAQHAIGQIRQLSGMLGEGSGARVIDEALRLADRLQTNSRWAGLAHSVKGDAYYWYGIYSFERTFEPHPFTARRSFELALQEYDMALSLQPDDVSIRHGKALAYLELGKAETKDKMDLAILNKAVHETEAVLQSAPDSERVRQTRIEAYEEAGEYATAARLQRNFLSDQQSTQKPLTLVPYSAISHGADRYTDFRVLPPWGGGAGVALSDEEVIVPFYPRPYESSVHNELWLMPNALGQYRSELRNYGLLRDELLSGNYETMINDLKNVPEEVRQSPHTLLLGALAQLLNQPEDSVTPLPKTQDTIDKASTSLEENAHLFVRPYQAGEPPPKGDDIFYREAGNFFRQYKQYDNALHVYTIWRTELERDGADEKRRAEAEKSVGESLFLKGDDKAALAAFDRAAQLRPDWPPYTVRQAFMHEQLGDYDQAAALYQRAWQVMQQRAEWMPPEQLEVQPPWSFYSPDNYQAIKHLGDVLLKQAENARQAENENTRKIREKYANAAEMFRTAIVIDLTQQTFGGTDVQTTAAAVNNLGIALLMAKDYQDSIEVMETLVLSEATWRGDKDRDAEVLETLAGPLGIPDAWRNPYDPEEISGSVDPPASDESNPIFHLNLGWAYELNGEPRKARDQYLAAVRSDPTFHPALNDLGVLAAQQGNLDEAKGYFRAALRAKPNYAYASYNLGVALLRSGLQSFLAAQYYLGQAVQHDRSLIDKPYGYVFDNDLFFLNLSLGDRVPPDWTFAKDAQRSTLQISLVVVALLFWRIIRTYAVSKSRETVIGKAFDTVRAKLGERLMRLPARLRHGWVGFQRLGLLASNRSSVTLLALFVTPLAILIVQGWSLLWEASPNKMLVLGVVLYLSFVSLLVHHAGHALAALRYHMRVHEAPWPAGIAQAITLVAIGGPAFCPMPAASVSGEADPRRRSFIYLAGPLASLSFAALLYVLFLWCRIPMLHFGVTLNLAMASASLLLMPPLDAAKMDERYYGRLTFWIATCVTVMAAPIGIAWFL